MFAGIAVLISGFQCFVFIHIASLRSVKIVSEESGNFSASDEWQPGLLIMLLQFWR